MSTKTQWETVIKPAFLKDVFKLPRREIQQVMDKITMLAENPHPDGWAKKQLTHVPGRPYRLRSGKYRIFYTFNQQVISIYKLDERSDDTYNDTVAPAAPPPPEAFANLDIPTDTDDESVEAPLDWQNIFVTSESRKLPEPITQELLKRLEIPAQYHACLLSVQDEDALLTCQDADEKSLLKILDYMFEPSLYQAMQGPDLVLNDVDDLLRYKDGELLAFLLKLSPEQERAANWSLRVNGPTLVKGSPGTGKSMVALYRIRSLLTQLLQAGESPRLLFTTYTNALVKSSRQLLDQLLGPNASYVRVDTADTIAHFLLQERGQDKTHEIIGANDLYKLTANAINATHFTGNQLQQQAQKQTIQRMSREYLVEEFTSVIIARHITTLEAYQKVLRAGRKMRLNAMQRAAVWQVYEHWRLLLQDQGRETWQQRRVRVDVLAASSSLAHAYDAVIIDEAQDLDPSALHMLVTLCKSPNRLLITADANQSIYGSVFSWTDVHESLKFTGRASVLRVNYRSTAEIGEATRSYLLKGELEAPESDRTYMNNGPLPTIRAVLNTQNEVELLINYFKKASRSLRHTLSSCAVLCPSESAGRALEKALRQHNLDATFMKGVDLNLAHPGIKILTFKSSKGLEFPVVALAGFMRHTYPIIPNGALPDERDEILARERRTMFVGMTRAMRALLVIVPASATTPLLRDFDPSFWNLDRAF
ncbi:MAG: UvrD-helicase domain-containing protein [Ktedonobacteraceae bacterium]|nr:UvrD-helicase domain-containing protein [Ktedonobacteraceae bacterium]